MPFYEEGLLPCPFCGSTDVRGYRSPFPDGTSEVICYDCGNRTMRFRTYDEAKEKWNRRDLETGDRKMTCFTLCPLCGGRADIGRTEDDCIAVRCTECGVSVARRNPNEAIEAWNKRVRE